MSGFSNTPRILRGAFVEHGKSMPPLVVPFQFNPETISRNRTNSFAASGQGEEEGLGASLRDFFLGLPNLTSVRDLQDVTIGMETISFDIRLDATDKLESNDPITMQFGILPQLSTLELMMYPKSESLASEFFSTVLGVLTGFSFTDTEKPPMILFVWGRKKVLPVNITSMRITEQEFTTELNPIRATVAVSITVIEGPNGPYKYSRAMKETMSAVNMLNLAQVTNVIIPM